MNMIAAAFLLYLNEEEAFCLLITLVEDMLKGYYTKEMLGSCVDQRVFEVLPRPHTVTRTQTLLSRVSCRVVSCRVCRVVCRVSCVVCVVCVVCR
jgi:hypothetical protein